MPAPVPETTRLNDVAKEAWDVVVVGGGPAGSSAANVLASRGRRVLVLDRHGFPRDKVCGDGLIPDALRAIDRLGAGQAVRARGLALGSVAIWSPGRTEVVLSGRFVTLRRVELDAALLDTAVRRGAVLARGDVAGVASEDGSAEVRVRGLERPIEARVCLVATGADPRLAPGYAAGRIPSAVAIRRYVRSTVELDRLVVSYDRSILPGYAWIFPLPDGWFNVGCGVFLANGRSSTRDLRRMFDRFEREFPTMRAIAERATERTEPRGAPLRCGLAEPPSTSEDGRVSAIGETIGATFPFTGEGIGKAMETGEMAADRVDRALSEGAAGPMLGFEADVRESLEDRYTGYRAAERWLSSPWLADLLAARARRSPALRRAAAGILDETVDPREVFSVGGLLRSFGPAADGG